MRTLKEFLQYIDSGNRSVIGFGTGEMAKEALMYPELWNHIKCFCDNDPAKQGRKVRIGGGDYDVISPDSLKENCAEGDIILITSGHFKTIREQITQLDLNDNQEVYDFPVLKVELDPGSEEFFEERLLKECMKEYQVVLFQYGIVGEERARKLEEKENYIRGKSPNDRPFVVPRTMIMPTTRCNLRCKGCSSLLPLFQNPQDVAVRQILQDCDVFFSAVDECIRLTIGGEPFLYPELEQILVRLIEEPKLLGIMLITNGVKTPDESLVPLLRNRKVLVEVSDYGRLESMSRTVAFLERNDVNFKVLTEQLWTDMGGVEKRGRSKEENRFVYLNCDQGRVIKGMHDGKFHTCARSARMLALGAYDSDVDYFELSDTVPVGEIRKRLLDVYYSDYADACDHCDLGSLPTKIIEAGIQMSGNIAKSGYTIVNREDYERLVLLSSVTE